MRPLLLEQAIRINAYDIDVMGIVSNIVYVRWFEDLRFAFLQVYYPYTALLKDNISPILGKTIVEYKRPLTIQDKPIGKIWVQSLSRSRWVTAFEITSNNKVCCIGEQHGYFFNIARNRPMAIPERLQIAYQEDVERLT